MSFHRRAECLFIRMVFFASSTSHSHPKSLEHKTQNTVGGKLCHVVRKIQTPMRKNFSHKIFITKSLNEKEEKNHSLRFNQNLIFCLLTQRESFENGPMWNFSHVTSSILISISSCAPENDSHDKWKSNFPPSLLNNLHAPDGEMVFN